MLRAEEDYRQLSGYQTMHFLERLKYISLGEKPGFYLSVGGEFRSQYERFNNLAFGAEEDDPSGWLLQRLMLHTDWRLGRFRIFTQFLSASHFFETTESSPVERDDLNLHQGFIEYRFDLAEDQHLTARLGRQELWYGSRRLISVREGPNVRLSFDAAKVVFETPELKIDAFYAQPVRNQPTVFDNSRISDEKLWSAYAVLKTPRFVPGSLDLYYIGLQSDRRLYEEGQASETRHSIGLRHWGEYKRWRYNHELVYQFGSFGKGDISAYTISVDVAYRLSERGWKPEIGLKTEIISGDKAQGDGDLNTFNALYPRAAYFGLIAQIGPANLVDFHPSITFNPFADYEFTLDWDFFWRHRLSDGFYGPNAFLERPGSASNQRFLGHQPGFEMARGFGRYWEASFEGSWFITSDFFEQTGEGRNILHFAVTTRFKF